jgi:hypothetical protein
MPEARAQGPLGLWTQRDLEHFGFRWTQFSCHFAQQFQFGARVFAVGAIESCGKLAEANIGLRLSGSVGEFGNAHSQATQGVVRRAQVIQIVS